MMDSQFEEDSFLPRNRFGSTRKPILSSFIALSRTSSLAFCAALGCFGLSWVFSHFGCHFYELFLPHSIWFQDEKYTNYCTKYDNSIIVDISKMVISGKEFMKMDMNSEVAFHGKVPKIIHQQYAIPKHVPKYLEPYVRSCHEKNSDWVHVLWTDEDFETFLKTYFPAHIHTLNRLPFHIQKIDAIRYFLLYQFGGVYLDADVRCIQPLNDWLGDFPQTILMEPIHIMSSPPKDPLWHELIELVDNRSRSFFTKWNHTGGNIVHEHIFNNYRGVRDDILVDTAEVLFRKKYMTMLGVSSWYWRRTKMVVLWSLNIAGVIALVISAYVMLKKYIGTKLPRHLK